MNRYARGVLVVFGLAAIVAGLGVAVAFPGSGSSGVLVGFVGLIALVGVVGALWKVAGTADGGDDGSVAAPPWSAAGALADPTPERSRTDPRLSGTRLGAVIEEAGATARSEQSVEAGLAVVRPELRAALVDALVQGRTDERAVEASLAEGTWTDDRMAAAVLDGTVSPPDRPLPRRVETWLFPERAVVRRTGRAVQAMAEAADEALPTIVGQWAPRSVPVLPPTLEDLQRAADGTLRPALDPRTVARGPEPLHLGDETAGKTGSDPGDGEASRDGSGDGDIGDDAHGERAVER